MENQTQGVTLAVVLKIDYASPESSIDSFNSVDDHLTALLTAASEELCDAEIAADKCRASAEVEIRNTAANTPGSKLTEGYVAALLDKNDDVSASAAKVKRLATRVAGYRAAIASLERKHSLFKRWLDNQRPIGLNER